MENDERYGGKIVRMNAIRGAHERGCNGQGSNRVTEGRE